MILDAKLARKIATNAPKKYTANRLNLVLSNIKIKADRGDFSLTIYDDLSKSEIEILEKELGYEVEYSGALLSWEIRW